jgi:thiol-disulfide isomerase/thioredoxin
MMVRTGLAPVAMLTALPAFAGGIDFFQGSFDEAVAKARQEGRLVFVDVYTDWCAPCKKMAKTVFVLEEVGETFNRHFVSYKLNAEDAAQNGPQIASRFEVNSYPTYLFLDGDGQLISRKGGAMSPEAFRTLALTASGLADASIFCRDYEAGDRGIDAFLRCHSHKVLEAREYSSANPDSKNRFDLQRAADKEYQAYYATVPEGTLLSTDGFRLIANAPGLRRGQAPAEFLVRHYAEFARMVEPDVLARTIAEANWLGITMATFTDEERAGQWVEDIRGVLAEAYALAGPDNGADAYGWYREEFLANLAYKKKDWPAFVAANERQATLAPEAERIELLGGIGARLLAFGCTDQAILRAGAAYVALALDKDETFGNMLVYGRLLSGIGEAALAETTHKRMRAMLAAEQDPGKKAQMRQALDKALKETTSPAAAAQSGVASGPEPSR